MSHVITMTPFNENLDLINYRGRRTLERNLRYRYTAAVTLSFTFVTLDIRKEVILVM